MKQFPKRGNVFVEPIYNNEEYTLFVDEATGIPNINVLYSNVALSENRNDKIIELVKELYDNGKNVLCLSKRLAQIDLLYEKLVLIGATTEKIHRYDPSKRTQDSA